MGKSSQNPTSKKPGKFGNSKSGRDRGDRRTSFQQPKLIVKIANAEDEASGDGYDVFRFRKPLGRKGLIHIPRDKARNAREVMNLLARKNADLSADDITEEATIKKAIAMPPLQHWLMASHVGWRPDNLSYVLQNRIIGRSIGKLRIKAPVWINDRQRSVVGQNGDFAKWTAGVAEVSRYSTRLMLAMSAPCAAFLLKIAGLQPFALNLFGPAKSGKTTALLAGVSIIGLGDESQLPNWNTTDSGFQETARLFNDSIMPANELALLKGGRKDAYARIRQRTYVFSEGRDTSRNSASAFAIPASSATWRGILFSTAEDSFDSLATASDEHRDHGELARSHDVPAVTGGRATIFDLRPAGVPKRKFRSWARRQLRLLRDACAANHGWAIDPVILKIISLGTNAENYVRDCIDEFLAELKKQPSDGALRHAAQNFGLIYAGGCLLIDAGVTTWDRAELRRAIVGCFRDFLEVVRVRDSIPQVAKTILLEKLHDLELPVKKDGANLVAKPNVGFVRQGKSRKRFVINSRAFADWFPDGKHQRAALLWLDRTGKLHKTGNPGVPSESNKQWAVTFAKWSSTRSIRAIEFDDPIQTKASKSDRRPKKASRRRRTPRALSSLRLRLRKQAVK